MNREELMQKNMELITFIGSAKSTYLEAIDAALEGKMDLANNLMTKANEDYITGHKVHHEILTAFMNDETMRTDLLTVHAQCQLMSAEDMRAIAGRVVKECEKKISE